MFCTSASTSETVSPVLLTPASSHSSPNQNPGYSAMTETNQKPFGLVDPAAYSAMNQNFPNRPGFAYQSSSTNTTPEACLMYIHGLTQAAYNGSLRMGKGVTLEYIQALGQAAYQDFLNGVEESPFMAELMQMVTEFNATGNTANPLNSIKQHYHYSSEEPGNDGAESYSNVATACKGDGSGERPAGLGRGKWILGPSRRGKDILMVWAYRTMEDR